MNGLLEEQQVAENDQKVSLDQRKYELFPKEVWFQGGKLTFPKGKNSWTQEELDFFKEVIKEKLEINSKSFAFTLEEEQEGSSEKSKNPFEESSAASSANVRNLPRLGRNVADLRFALQRIAHKTYGKCMNGTKLIHPYRLFSVPHSTKCIEEKIS